MHYNIQCVDKIKRWVPPIEKFVEYEDKDESWLRYFGMGKEIEETITHTIDNLYIFSIETFQQYDQLSRTKVEFIGIPDFVKEHIK